MRTRALRAGLTAACLLAVVGCGGSTDDSVRTAQGEGETEAVARYSDAIGDAGSHPDIRTIEVASTPEGQISLLVTLQQFTPRSKTGVDLWLDTDADPETGNTTFDDAGGAEFLFAAFPPVKPPADVCGPLRGGNGCLGRYSPGTWVAATAPSARVSRTATGFAFSINRSDLGGTDEFNFFAIYGTPDGFTERAPGTGIFNYSLELGGPRPEASTASSDKADKAGGTSDAGPVVLTLAERNYNAIEPDEFAAAVERLSGGSVRIEVTNGYRYYDVDYERATIADVRSGVFDLAHVGARAWAAAGVKSFNALVAPFLVDSYELERRVLESERIDRMLEGVEPLGLVGIAVTPGELRRPLGITRTLVRPTDYRGARIGIRPAGVADATFDSLGAEAEGFPATPEGLVGYDGAESGVAAMAGNGYDKGARALTANVVLWPRAGTIVMNRKVFDSLTEEQQDMLRAAGAEVLEPVFATIEASETEALVTICERSRRPLVMASRPDRAALRRAVQPVYDDLERDSLTAEVIDEIESMRDDEGVSNEPLRCKETRPATLPAALDGRWRIDLTRDDLRGAGAQLEQLERAEGSWTVEFEDGRWVARNRASGLVYRGTYGVSGTVLRETVRSCNPANTCAPGAVEEYTWSVYRDQLSLEPIPGRPFNVAAVAKPFTRAR